MGPREQLHDRDTALGTSGLSATMDTKTALLIGRMASTVDSNTQTVSELTATVKSLAEAISDQRVDQQRYWSGLEKANGDIRTMSDSLKAILIRLDNSVPLDRFEKLETHVKSLNGTDAKFSALGIDFKDERNVEEWRNALISLRARRRIMSDIRTKVLQTLAATLALALCIAAWDGIRDAYIRPAQHQEHTDE